MRRPERARTARAGAALALATMALAVSACGRASTTGVATDTGAGGPLVAKLACPQSVAMAMGGSAPNSGPTGTLSPSVDDAVHAFLATSFADHVRGLTFQPATAPPMSPVQSVVAGTMPPGAMPPSPPDTSAATPEKWYAHRDGSGEVTATLHLVQQQGGWTVDQVEYCGTPPDDQVMTATTGSVTRSSTVTSKPTTSTVVSIPPTSAGPTVPSGSTSAPGVPTTTPATMPMGGP